MKLAIRIKVARQRARMTQGELAAAIGLNQRATLGYWETGRRRPPSPETVLRIAEVCGVDPEWLSTAD